MVCCAGQAVFIFPYFVFLYLRKCVVLTVLCMLCMCVAHSVCCPSSFCDTGRYTAKPHTALGVGKELPFPNTWETDRAIMGKLQFLVLPSLCPPLPSLLALLICPLFALRKCPLSALLKILLCPPKMTSFFSS